ncbi:S-layer homology domain-containing protein [Ureibacillus thermosphaericus]|uniref:S-layer homology domain-containing protein n=1 Tax=Ureibacillus thermosphaericus TaxID=51173 RepID=UPI0030C90D2D
MANQPKKYKKFVATAATATLVASAIVPVASAASFTDVAGNTHAEAINALADQGIINGYADGSFKPNAELTRASTVKLLGRWLESQGYEIPADWNQVQRFNDLPVTAEAELVKYAALVKDAGVFNGSNGNLNYNDTMQRQQMATVLVRAIKTVLGVDLVAEYKAAGFTSNIQDLDKVYGQENRESIIALEYAGITVVENFNPGNTVTRGQFASFLYRTINLELVAANVEAIRAINNTTVEVDFVEPIDNINALNFTIDGLEVTNAVVKQTDSSVAVLTTSPQEGGKTYTVSEGGNKLGTFEGISAVVPTAVKTTVASYQGVIGKEVTVKAEVEVPSGQSKAGIPVTFNIVDKDTNRKNEKIEVEVYTNENGVAEYAYTRYYEGVDEVVAYATDKSSVNDEAKVYWADTAILTVKADDDTKVANGDRVKYEIKGNKDLENTLVFVAFKENLDVKIDEVIDDVYVVDSDSNYADFVKDRSQILVYDRDADKFLDGDADEEELYSYYVDSKDYRIVGILLDDNAEASFTLTGEGATVTPIVYAFYDNDDYEIDIDDFDADSSKDEEKLAKLFKDSEYERDLLQAVAESATFEEGDSLQIDIEAKGVSNAAGFDKDVWGGVLEDGYTIPDFDFDSQPANLGGRDYVVTVKDEDGDRVGKGYPVHVFVDEDDIDNKEDVFLIDVDGNVYSLNDENVVQLEADKNGQVKFVIVGESTGYAAPTVWIDNDKYNDELDKKEPRTVAEKVYFKAPSIKNARIEIKDLEGDEITSIAAGEKATVSYISEDQNGKRYYDADDEFVATFTVTAKTTDAIVDGKRIRAGKSETFKVDSVNGVATIVVEGTNKGNITIKASSTSPSLSTVTKTLRVVGENEVADTLTGYISHFNPTRQTIRIDGRDSIKYDLREDTFIDDREGKKEEIRGTKFEDILEAAEKAGTLRDIKVKFEKGEEGNVWTIVAVKSDEKPSITDPNFVDQDTDEDQISGELTFTATNADEVTVKVGDLDLTPTEQNGQYAVKIPADTTAADIVITATNDKGTTTVTLELGTDFTDKKGNSVQLSTLKGFTIVDNTIGGWVVNVPASSLTGNAPFTLEVNGKSFTFDVNLIDDSLLMVEVPKSVATEEEVKASIVTSN